MPEEMRHLRTLSGYLLLAAYILPEQQTNLRINPDDAEIFLSCSRCLTPPTDLWKLKKAPNKQLCHWKLKFSYSLSYDFFNACKYLLNILPIRKGLKTIESNILSSRLLKGRAALDTPYSAVVTGTTVTSMPA